MDRTAESTHPVLACAQTIEDAMKAVADVEAVFMTVTQKREALIQLSRVVDQVGELRGRVLVAADDVASEDGARDAAAWLAHRARLSADPRRSLGLAQALERWPLVSTGVRQGTVNLEQAGVIVRALDVLPATLDPEVREQCEARLVVEAATFGPAQLRVMGRRIHDIVEPDAAESREAEALEQEEREARRRTYLRWCRNGDGTVDLKGRVADAVFSRLLTYLEAFTSPRQRATRGPAASNDAGGPSHAKGPADDRRPYDQRMGSALARSSRRSTPPGCPCTVVTPPRSS